jgi:hypothetical protein
VAGGISFFWLSCAGLAKLNIARRRVDAAIRKR